MIDPPGHWCPMPKLQRVAPCGVSTGVRAPLAQEVTIFAQAGNVDLAADAEEPGQIRPVRCHHTLQEVVGRRFPPSAAGGNFDSLLSYFESVVDLCRVVEEAGVASPELLFLENSLEPASIRIVPQAIGGLVQVRLHATGSPRDPGVSRFPIRIFHPAR